MQERYPEGYGYGMCKRDCNTYCFPALSREPIYPDKPLGNILICYHLIYSDSALKKPIYQCRTCVEAKVDITMII